MNENSGIDDNTAIPNIPSNSREATDYTDELPTPLGMSIFSEGELLEGNIALSAVIEKFERIATYLKSDVTDMSKDKEIKAGLPSVIAAINGLEERVPTAVSVQQIENEFIPSSRSLQIKETRNQEAGLANTVPAVRQHERNEFSVATKVERQLGFLAAFKPQEPNRSLAPGQASPTGPFLQNQLLELNELTEKYKLCRNRMESPAPGKTSSPIHENEFKNLNGKAAAHVSHIEALIDVKIGEFTSIDRATARQRSALNAMQPGPSAQRSSPNTNAAKADTKAKTQRRSPGR
ncbi:hypothetical protein FGM00_11255 [Aggregatimonas sangjinii]|uniref:Uncharacterized protein n=1 Tax=Aggregatimonas sangjinii TaxID=2583587 RepID=A0A5B7SVH7_9FLAO|nr:hypothetical protein [Aggregatimonas sangjinii]QCX00654.1 hypothetical protein FGM00_11255 [Aggregatimonas sangjinii]